MTKLQCLQINKNMTHRVPCHVCRGAGRMYTILQGGSCVLKKFVSPYKVEKQISYELLFKVLLFAVVKMTSCHSCMSFRPYNLESRGDR